MKLSILTRISEDVLYNWSEDFQKEVNNWILQKCKNNTFLVFKNIKHTEEKDYYYKYLTIDYSTWNCIKNIAYEANIKDYDVYNILCKLYIKYKTVI